MKKLMILFAMCLIFLFAIAGTAAADMKHCSECGMDMAASHNGMVVTYTDGTSVEVCSIHCAVENMEKNKDKQVKSITVADYGTGEMTDAKTAVWVIGGSKKGWMSAVPKWAFAKDEDARKFVVDNGGRVASFDEVAAGAKGELSAGGEHHGGMAGMPGCTMNMEPGSQMLFNPGFGDDIYHAHPAGMWMVNYKYMHMNMTGLRAGTTDYNVNSGVGYSATGTGYKYNYMNIPTSMAMDMQMLMVMYGITDHITVMVMPNFVNNSMNMLMDMGYSSSSGMRQKQMAMGTRNLFTMPTMNYSGIGDTEVRGIYKIDNHFVGSLGLSLPTGKTDEYAAMMGMTFKAPYDMQLGSGTYDLKPALTYSVVSEDAKWNWGAQAEYTYHTDSNDGWHFGDSFHATSWLQRAFGPATLWTRIAYTDTARIHGSDQSINMWNNMGLTTVDADPKNYGGQRIDVLFGTTVNIGSFAVGAELGLPVYQDLNGLQLQTSWLFNVGVQYMF